jgi:fucose 4-O-acetylase-like acetyltransferase
MSLTAQAKPKREHLLDIERGKGLGIILVVYGHLVMYGTLGEQHWYAASKYAVYLFHMPFFMYLSGFIFFYTGACERASRGYQSYIAKRADRLLVPFVVMLIVVVTGKYLVSRFSYVDTGFNGYLDGFHSAFFNTEYSPVLSIWYILVLFVYSAVTPLLWPVLGRKIFYLLAFAFVLYWIPATTDFYLFRILHYFVFFVLGGVVFTYREFFFEIYRRFLPVFWVLFCLSLLLSRDWYPALLVSGVLSIPALHGLVRLKLFEKDRWLRFFGENSLVIYLLNTIFIGLAKAVYVRFLPYDGVYFVVMIVVLFLSGLLLPIAAKYAVARLSVTRPLLRYVT